MADVFVSYSRSDEGRVELLVRALEAHGISVWWDRSLEQGAGFAALIRDEIANAAAVVVCWSAGAAGSRWVQSEADEAEHQQKYVGVLIAPGRAPPPFNTLNSANLQSWQGNADDRQLLSLLRDVGRRIGREDIAQLADAEDKRLAEDENRRQAAAEVERIRAERQRQEAERQRQEGERERAKIESKIARERFNRTPLLLALLVSVGVTAALILIGGPRSNGLIETIVYGYLVAASIVFVLAAIVAWILKWIVAYHVLQDSERESSDYDRATVRLSIWYAILSAPLLAALIPITLVFVWRAFRFHRKRTAAVLE